MLVGGGGGGLGMLWGDFAPPHSKFNIKLALVVARLNAGDDRVCSGSLPDPTLFFKTILFRLHKTHLLSQQKYACRDKTFVMPKIFCHDKHNFVATKVLSWQSYFVVTKDLFCRDNHVFVVTKMILVAAPANGKIQLGIFNTLSKSKKQTPVCCRLQRMCARLCRPSRPCCTARPSRSPRQNMCPSWPWRCTRTTCCCCLCSTSAGLSLR